MNAKDLDAQDPLRHIRSRFVVPKDKLYLCNNSLGLPPISAVTKMQEQLGKWATEGVKGWKTWYTLFEDSLRGPLSRLLGAREEEVIVMNSLTVNLHLLLTSFYRPTPKRYKILVESPIFPSDLYAVKSHITLQGLDPEEALVMVEIEEIEKAIAREGDALALVYCSSVNFLTGEVLDTKGIAACAKKVGALVGFDVAHAAGNIPLHLHDWGVDFAVGCSYKYLCSGPGGPGIAYVHAKHHEKELPRVSGWWGNDPATRFQMHLQPEFIPHGGAASWQVSTPSILSMTPLIASLEIFDEIGMEAFVAKSKLQTEFLLKLLGEMPKGRFEVITGDERGCQISIRFFDHAEECMKELENIGVIVDFRPPDIVRITPSPLYNTFEEIAEFAARFTRLFPADKTQECVLQTS